MTMFAKMKSTSCKMKSGVPPQRNLETEQCIMLLPKFIMTLLWVAFIILNIVCIVCRYCYIIGTIIFVYYHYIVYIIYI